MSINISLNTNIIADESIELKKIKDYEKLVHSDDLEHTHDVEIETIDETDGEFIGTESETSTTDNVVDVKSVTAVNELPELSMQYEKGLLKIGFSRGTQVQVESLKVTSSEHTHKFTPNGNVNVSFKKSKKKIQSSGRNNQK